MTTAQLDAALGQLLDEVGFAEVFAALVLKLTEHARILPEGSEGRRHYAEQARRMRELAKREEV